MEVIPSVEMDVIGAKIFRLKLQIFLKILFSVGGK